MFDWLYADLTTNPLDHSPAVTQILEVFCNDLTVQIGNGRAP
jgi:hypothetical protein